MLNLVLYMEKILSAARFHHDHGCVGMGCLTEQEPQEQVLQEPAQLAPQDEQELYQSS